MRTFTASDAKTRFGEFIDLVQKEPVRVTRRNCVVGVMVSADDYEAMRSFYVKRLQHTLKQTAEIARVHGLTDKVLGDLLGDES